MEKLVDVFNTQYFHRAYAAKVAAYLNEHKEVDIAKARLSKNVVDVVSTAIYNGAYIIDSYNPYRHSLLEENRRRKAYQEEYDRNVTDLPTPKSEGEMYDLIRDLNPAKIYRVASDAVNLYFAILVSIYTPKIQLDFHYSYPELFTYINDNLDMSHFKHKPLKQLVGASFIDVTPNPDGSLYIPFFGDVPYEDAVSRELYIPKEFGEEYLDSDSDFSPWSKFIDRVIEDFRDSLMPTSYSLKDFI